MKITLKQKAYNYLLKKITSGVLKPGERISEVAMAEEIGISPTPLREAYRQLASEGIVTHIPNSGICVRELDKNEIAELYGMREALETFAVRKAAQRMEILQIDELKDCCDIQERLGEKLFHSKLDQLSPDDQIEYMHADATFHLNILNATENSIIIKTMKECHIMSHLLSSRSHKHNLTQIETTINHHLGILKSIEAHDPDNGEKWMRRHIQFSAKTALNNQQICNAKKEKK